MELLIEVRMSREAEIKLESISVGCILPACIRMCFRGHLHMSLRVGGPMSDVQVGHQMSVAEGVPFPRLGHPPMSPIP